MQEWRAVSLLALTSALLVGSLSLFWGGTIGSSIAIGVGILSSVAVSAIFATILPVILYRMKLDPKIASGPVVLMIVDMLTIAIYLSFAAWWLGD